MLNTNIQSERSLRMGVTITQRLPVADQVGSSSAIEGKNHEGCKPCSACEDVSDYTNWGGCQMGKETCCKLWGR